MTNYSSKPMKNPWLGLSPYKEGTQLYGRDTESLFLFNTIKDNIATILYGKSGIGKTSLINAGVSPMLRKENFIPIRIRLVHNVEISYVDQIENAVRDVLHCHDILPVSVPNLGLWDFFHRHIFTTSSGEQCTPVVILDQFEEVYNLTENSHKYEIPVFFNELSFLLNNIKPDVVVAHEKGVGIQDSNDTSTLRRFSIKHISSPYNYNEDINFRLVLSLREDKLYLLERSSSNIPALKINRFNLLALTSDAAKEVIERPYPHFFSNEEIRNIINKLSSYDDEGNQMVDLAILSLFLYKCYERSKEVGYDNIFSDYYEETLSMVGHKVMTYLEDNLITKNGYRAHVPVVEANENGLYDSDLRVLQKRKLIKIYRIYNVEYIEFSHDRICAEANKHRTERISQENIRASRKRILLVLLPFMFAIAIISGIIVISNKSSVIAHKYRIEQMKNHQADETIKDLHVKLQVQERLVAELTQKNSEYNATITARDKRINELEKSEIDILNSKNFVDAKTRQWLTDSIIMDIRSYINKDVHINTIYRIINRRLKEELR